MRSLAVVAFFVVISMAHAQDWPVLFQDDFEKGAERWQPTLAFLPIGGHFTMDPIGAAQAVEYLGISDVAPMHYGTFPILAGTPDALRSELAKRGLGDVRVHATTPGGTLE